MAMTQAMESGQQRLGGPVDAKAAMRPGPVMLQGRFARVEKLDPARHGADLWDALGGRDSLWTYTMSGPFADSVTFASWLNDRATRTDPFAYAVIDKRTGRASGSLALMEIRPAMRVIEVGSIVYSPELQRHAAATEAQYLVACYVFETLGYRRFEWKCDALNAPSMRAAARFGFAFEGIFRQHMIYKGRNRDTAWFSITDGEWPERKATYERWLASSNFDEAGVQRERLSEMNAATMGRLPAGAI